MYEKLNLEIPKYVFFPQLIGLIRMKNTRAAIPLTM